MSTTQPRRRRKLRAGRILTSTLVAAAGVALAAPASAQQTTFHLDRLEMPGAPDDGVVLFRPETQQRSLFYGQLGLGYSLRPLRTRNITSDSTTLGQSRTAVIQDQLAVYGNAGFELLDRAILSVNFPWYPFQDGGQPNYPSGSILASGPKATNFGTSGPTAGDIRLDFRFTIARSDDRRSALGAQLNYYAAAGTRTNFGGDGSSSAMLMMTGEHTIKWLTLVGNMGFHFRPRHAINDPVNENGLGVSDEWRWSVGALVPLKAGKYRIGATIFGQTGLTGSDPIVGDTFFTKQNTPIEFDVEGRMRFGPANHWWAGVSAGTAILRGYGAPDLRMTALVGTYVPILDTDPHSPERRAELRARRRDIHSRDSDNDGIPDDIDACPSEPEDHLGNDPSDGCPMPPDRDHDGIPDQYDKCPDVPEDKDGVDDGDGCPEDDADNDGIPDAQDACPKEPGQKSPDPKKNGCPTFIKVEGNVVRILQQVHFAYGSATILPESFPMLQEITNLLKANKGIKKMSIEGHTDNRGAADLNKKLSQNRANSVMNWLVQHGIEGGRLEAHGYGMEKPIEDNATDEGRAKNRRVEFKILDEEDSNKPQK